ncbi:serine/threonine-protein kinase [Curtobacterium sp. VKM Ac-1376]|uniref:serine/threonine-protein kinase n=1 Tax=Curtobacterium sp. VKM Ac-1376 TaxID=123312 RepID=UPI001889C735|nr:serine/threonine-protein kinase [Curtobacterium sp. VKM Ac-1376]MBF4614410.1 serine/threonine protein kinase [Curtobacterium sp. VKM Ac-1376]
MEERVFGGRYRVTGTLGHGGMASVYRAVDEQLGREVAVKVFRIGPVDRGERARAEAEIQTLATLRAPELVTLYDAALDDVDGDSYLVMELVPGSDLATRLREGPLDTATAARLGAQVADGLRAVHAQGIVHRDVKPANVLLERDGRHVKLADFGIALLRDASRVTGTGTVMGTAAYLAPEQVLAQEITGKADVYSLGLVLLECLTGRQPFPGSAVESATARLTRSPEIDRSLPTAWRTLLHVMTAQDPAERPTAAEAAERLRALDRDEPTNATQLLPGTPGAMTAAAAGVAGAAAAAGVGAAAAASADDRTQAMPLGELPDGAPGDGATRVLDAQRPNPADDVSTTVLGAQAGRGGPADGASGGGGGVTPPPAVPVPASPEDDESKKKRGPLIAAIIVIVLVLIGIGVAVFALNGDDDGTPTPTDTTSTAPTDQQPDEEQPSEDPGEEQQPSQPSEQQPSQPEQQPSQPAEEPSEEPSEPAQPTQDAPVGPEPSAPASNPVEEPQDSTDAVDTSADTAPGNSGNAPGKSGSAPGQNKG